MKSSYRDMEVWSQKSFWKTIKKCQKRRFKLINWQSKKKDIEWGAYFDFFYQEDSEKNNKGWQFFFNHIYSLGKVWPLALIQCKRNQK